jgi:outer membrane receptor protein involved in Fe transport
MLTVGPAFAQTDSDALRRLQEENAALRRRLAEVEGAKAAQPAPAPATTTQPVAMQPSVSDQPADKDTLVLSPFQVTSDQDYGYLKTNSSTATRIGMEIQKIPLNISVVSEDFINDTNMKDIQDVFRYVAASAGDGRMGVQTQPGNSFTPSGNLSLRGFPVNARLRNGLLRYTGYTLDNVDRVELIKGPAAVFFGNAFPGGVINYVTKQPSFSRIPTSITYSYSGYDNRIGGDRVTLDTNQAFSDKAAMRIVGAWDNGIGDARYEFQKGHTLNAGLTLKPLDSGKLVIAIEGEVLSRKRNQDDDSWRWPQGWFDAYKTPPANLIAAAGLSGNADPVAAYRARILNNIGAWIADVRTAANDQYIPLWTQPLEHGAYITDRAGNRVHDEKYNYYGIGTYTKEDAATFAITTDFEATNWLSVRHAYTSTNAKYERLQAISGPMADGVRFAFGAPTWQTYALDAYYHQLDLLMKARFAGIDNKFLVGGLYGNSYQKFEASNAHANLFPFYGYMPGAYDKPDEGYVSPIPAAFRHPQPVAWGYASQFVRNRAGQILTPQQIFGEYDPGIHIAPDISRIAEIDRGLVDASRAYRKEWYINWQGTAIQDRLTTYLGYRQEESKGPGQLVQANPPWYTVDEYALQNIPQSEWALYGLSAIFSRPRTLKGDSKMAGASFEVTKNINVYASYSESFLPSSVTYLGGDYDPAQVTTRATLLGLNPATELARLQAEGGLTEVENEKGKNLEFGVKISTDDNKLVGTFSVFRITRQNRNVDDNQRQTDEVLNYTLPGKPTASFARLVRWFSNSATQENEGAEFEAIWTPKRNYQALFSGSWIWRSETVRDPSLVITPTSAAATIISSNVVFANRLPYAPEFTFKAFNKYTFDHDILGNFGNGLSVGLGARYSSEMVISNDQNFNAARGGLQAGDYLVFDAVFSVPFEVFGYKMSSTLNVTNLLDEEYSEGNFSLAPPRAFTLSVGMKF